MRLRTFTAPDMHIAIKLVREAMGDEAIILSSEQHKGRPGVSVTAAVEMEDESALPPQTVAAAPLPRAREKAPDSPATDFLRFELQNILRFHNLPDLFTAKLMQLASGAELGTLLAKSRNGHAPGQQQLFRLGLEKLCQDYFVFEPLPFERHDLRLMLIGAPGIGKTLTAAKIAARLVMDGQPVQLITTDTKRAGGIEQLKSFTDILGVELHIVDTPQALAYLLQDAPRRMPFIIDTAGCNPYDRAELQELAAFANTDGIEPVLVMPAGGDSAEAIDLVEAFSNAILLKKMLVTRADTARRFGGVMAAAAAHGLAFSHASHSARVADTLKAMDGAQLAQFLLRYQL